MATFKPHRSETTQPILIKLKNWNYPQRLYPCKIWIRSDDGFL